jgi:hypothetical protein
VEVRLPWLEANWPIVWISNAGIQGIRYIRYIQLAKPSSADGFRMATQTTSLYLIELYLESKKVNQQVWRKDIQ